MTSRFDPTKTVPREAAARELKVKWQGFTLDDTSWERQASLITDGHAQMVNNYLDLKKLKKPDGLAAAADAEAVVDDGAAAQDTAQPPQPAIAIVDVAALVAFLSAPIGSEQANGIHPRPQKAGGSGAQRMAYNDSHVTNPATGQTVHKRAALSHTQKQMVDATPGQGRKARYVTGEIQPIIAEDTDGTGFSGASYYELHMGSDGRPLNCSDGILMLDGDLSVGYVRVLELRKVNGKRPVLRQSICARDAPRCSAVVSPLVKQGLRWSIDRSNGPPVLTSVLSLGRKVIASTLGGVDTLTFSTPVISAGGPVLSAASLHADMFSASVMESVTKDLMEMKVTELRDELEARGAWCRQEWKQTAATPCASCYHCEIASH